MRIKHEIRFQSDDRLTGEQRKRLMAFVHNQPSDRPLLACPIGIYMPQIYPDLCAGLPYGPISPDDLCTDEFLTDIERLYDAHQRVNDDLPFVAAPFTNMAWMEAILGCRIVNMGNSLYAETAVKDWDSWHWRAPNLENNLWACKLLEMTSSLVERSRGRFFVGQTLMRGVTDMLSALRGASLFVLDFYDYPETVQRAAALCADTFIQIAHAQLDLIPASDIGYCAGAQPLWAPEKIVWLQEDAMALISPTLFRRYILPEDRRILRQFPYTAFHLHGSSLWAVDILMEEENLNILELHDDSGQVNHEAILQTWKRIQTRKPVVASKIYDSQPSFLTWLDRVFTELSPAGLMFIIDVPSSIEGEMVRQWFLEKAARLAQE